MNSLSLLAIAFIIYACRECYSYVLLLRDELTLSQRKLYAQQTNLLYNCFRENRLMQIACNQKPYRVLKPVLPVTTKIEQKTGQKRVKTIHGDRSNF